MLLSRVLVIGNILLDVHGRERSRAEVGAGMWVCVLWSCVSSGTSVCVCVRARARVCVLIVRFGDGGAFVPEGGRAFVPEPHRAFVSGMVSDRVRCFRSRVVRVFPPMVEPG